MNAQPAIPMSRRLTVALMAAGAVLLLAASECAAQQPRAGDAPYEQARDAARSRGATEHEADDAPRAAEPRTPAADARRTPAQFDYESDRIRAWRRQEDAAVPGTGMPFRNGPGTDPRDYGRYNDYTRPRADVPYDAGYLREQARRNGLYYNRQDTARLRRDTAVHPSLVPGYRYQPFDGWYRGRSYDGQLRDFYRYQYSRQAYPYYRDPYYDPFYYRRSPYYYPFYEDRRFYPHPYPGWPYG